MSVTTFTTVNGRIIRQNKDGVVHNFVSDPQGSVVMVRDTSGNTVYEAEYDPYGNVQSETGTNPSSLGFVGTLGYIKDSATSMYVRARYLLTNLGRWLTKDPLWPSEPGYVYANAAPSLKVDPSGLATGVVPIIGIGVSAAVLALILKYLAISLAVFLLYMMREGIAEVRSRICKAFYKLLKDVCGDPDGRLADVKGKCCWEDPCQTLFYKGVAYQRCADIRYVYSMFCYGEVDDAHVGPIIANELKALECVAIFTKKCIGPFPPLPDPNFPSIYVTPLIR